MPVQTLSKTRIYLIDEIRGIAVILMIAYHAIYDLNVLFNLPLNFLFSPVIDLFRNAFISGPFIFIAGVSSNLSRNSLKRGIVALSLGFGFTVVTFLIIPSQLILFGVLHLLGSAMIITHLLKPFLNKLSSRLGAILFSLLFFITYGIPYGYIGFGSIIKLKLPEFIYSNNYLFPLGIHSAKFVSSDYYPLIPWLFIFFAGFYMGKIILSAQLPAQFYNKHSNILCSTGRYSMSIYLIHQPALLAIMYLISFIIKH